MFTKTLLGESSVILYACSYISYVHKLHKWEDPTGSFIVSKMNEDCRRLDPRQDSRCSITFPVLSSLVSFYRQSAKSMGRWKSGARESYIRPDLMFSIV
ncbi:uncharacterized protein [Asterias amurensis]|uniref:uncharacterized protein n=1 Tax=Asterias amurensis TaxID=7602 RepID=UPI003AB7663A